MRDVFMPRHTPYEEAWCPARACAGENRRVGNGMGPWFWCVPRRGDLRAVLVTSMPRHTPYEEASHSVWHGRSARAALVHTLRRGAVRHFSGCSASYFLAKRRRTSMPRSMVASGAANEILKWVSRCEKIPPGMISNPFSIARCTNCDPWPPGAFGKI